MSEGEHEKLEDMESREPVVWCRALELSPRRAILHYDEIALSCAEGGYLPALERLNIELLGSNIIISTDQKKNIFFVKNKRYLFKFWSQFF